MENAVEDVKNYINSAPDQVISLLDYWGFVTQNIFNPIRFNVNHSLETLKFENLNFKTQPGSKFQAPLEIGAYIMKKLTENPQDYYGCIRVIDQYDKNDRYKILESLDKGLKSRNKERVLDSIGQLGIILDNILEDASGIKHQQKAISWGASVTIGIFGALLTGDLSTGLLTSVGLAGAG